MYMYLMAYLRLDTMSFRSPPSVVNTPRSPYPTVGGETKCWVVRVFRSVRIIRGLKLRYLVQCLPCILNPSKRLTAANMVIIYLYPLLWNVGCLIIQSRWWEFVVCLSPEEICVPRPLTGFRQSPCLMRLSYYIGQVTLFSYGGRQGTDFGSMIV